MFSAPRSRLGSCVHLPHRNAAHRLSCCTANSLPHRRLVVASTAGVHWSLLMHLYCRCSPCCAMRWRSGRRSAKARTNHLAARPRIPPPPAAPASGAAPLPGHQLCHYYHSPIALIRSTRAKRLPHAGVSFGMPWCCAHRPFHHDLCVSYIYYIIDDIIDNISAGATARAASAWRWHGGRPAAASAAAARCRAPPAAAASRAASAVRTLPQCRSAAAAAAALSTTPPRAPARCSSSS